MDGARYLEDGRLTIFKRAGVYYARIRTTASGKYIWRSLKTSDEQAAIRAGRRLLFQLEQRADQGLPPKSKSFAAVIDDYIRYRERDHAHGKTSAGMLRQIVRVSKFWREYAGGLPIEAIDDKVMREFIQWRRDYYSSFHKVPNCSSYSIQSCLLCLFGRNGLMAVRSKSVNYSTLQFGSLNHAAHLGVRNVELPRSEINRRADILPV